MCKHLRVVSLFAALTMLSGCLGEEFGDIKQAMKEESQNLRGKVEPLPPVKVFEPHIYAATELLDPFSPSKMVMVKKGSNLNAPDKTRVKEPLELYDLEKLRMVGTLMQKNVMNALIRTPDRNVYSLKVGNHMGQNFGKVTSITETEVTLKETVEDSSGEWVERTTTVVMDEQEQKK